MAPKVGGSGPRSLRCWMCNSEELTRPYRDENRAPMFVRLCPKCDAIPPGDAFEEAA